MNIKDYILVIKDVVPTPLCDDIIKEYKNCNQWNKALTRGESTHRNCSTIPMSVQDDDYRRKLDFDVFNCTVKCIETYNNKFEYSTVDEDTGYDLLRYEEGGYYKQHVDSFLQEPRLISCSLALNDNFEGGEFGFFDNELKYKLNKGDAIMFPSNFMYPHQINTITKGTRYSIITWFR